MPSKKKTSLDPVTAKTEVPAPVKQKKVSSAKSAAATHKTPTRKAADRGASIAVAEPVFDAAAHHDEIARVAYFMWLDRGGQHGREQEDWLQAVEVVKARYAR